MTLKASLPSGVSTKLANLPILIKKEDEDKKRKKKKRKRKKKKRGALNYLKAKDTYGDGE